MFRLLLLDDAGIPVYCYDPTSTHGITDSSTDKTVLVSGLLNAINIFAKEMGGALQTVVFGDYKIIYRAFGEKEKKYTLILADNKDIDDIILILKAELMYRRILNLIIEIYGKNEMQRLFLGDILKDIDEKTLKYVVLDVLKESKKKKLIKLIKKGRLMRILKNY